MTESTPPNPFLAEHLDNPYPVYHALRAQHPVCRHEALRIWTVCSHKAAAQVLSGYDDFTSTKGISQTRNQVILRPTMLTTDPPEHTRLRALVQKAFTPRRVAEMEPQVRATAAALLDAALPRGHFDLVADFARRLPSLIVASILDVEPERLADFQRWSDAIIHSIAEIGARYDRAQVKDSYRELDAYFEEKIRGRRTSGGNDLLAGLVAASSERDALSTHEILQFCILLFVAGNETTANLIGNAVVALMHHPEQAVALQQDATRIPNAIEEALRYDAPVQGIFRTSRHPVTVEGVTIPGDEKVCVLIGAANRDPRQFPDPDRFDIARTPIAHVGFGHGIHFCLGAALARLESRVALQELLQRVPALRPAGPATRFSGPLVRGFTQFPVAVAQTWGSVAETE